MRAHLHHVIFVIQFTLWCAPVSNPQLVQRGQILVQGIGGILRDRNYPSWSEYGRVTVLPSETALIEVFVPSSNVLWPVAMCARTAFDGIKVKGSEWMGTSVWEPGTDQRPLLGVALMQETVGSWWTLDWLQQKVAPGILTARLGWHNNPAALADRLEKFVDVMGADERGVRAASFMTPHIRHLRSLALRRRVSLVG